MEYLVGALAVCVGMLVLLLGWNRHHRRNVQRALAKMSRVMEQSPVSIVITDTLGNIEYVNPKFTQVSGYTLEEVKGQNPRVLKSGKTTPEEYRKLWETITHGREWRGEFLTRKKNGGLYWESASISPIFDAQGKITHYIGIKEDITERKRAEDDQRLALSLLGATLESTADAILVVDTLGRVVRCNQKFGQMWQIPETMQRHPEDSQVIEYMLPQIQNPKRFQERIHDIFAAPGATSEDLVHLEDGRILECYSQPQCVDGMVVGRVWSFRDVTPVRKLLKEQEVNIELAKQLLTVVNDEQPRYVDLDENRRLFVEPLAMTCKAAGGDHYFTRVLPATDHRGARTVVSLKDQSGHEVNCVLRSIATDLIQHAILADDPKLTLEQQMERLNNRLCNSKLFQEDDFLTSVTVEIDHATQMMRYVCCGHPPLVVVRGKEVIYLPHRGNTDGKNLPIAAVPESPFTAGEWQLEAGDRVILYTDGLPEMPLQKQGYWIEPEEFKQIIEEIVADRPEMPVCEITRRLLDLIAGVSQEEVIPGGTTTAADDVTIIGMELEQEVNVNEMVIQPTDLETAIASVNEIYDLIAPKWNEAGFSDTEFRLRIVLEEAVINAWKHGNKMDPEKWVRVRWYMHNDFVLEFTNQGTGFDPNSIPDPRTLVRRKVESGRGVFMIRTVSSSMRWKQNGRQLVTTFAQQQNIHDNKQTCAIAAAPVRHAMKKSQPQNAAQLQASEVLMRG